MVAGNIALRPRGSPRAARVLDLVRFRSCAGRYPPRLSGGQQQRVAAARARAPIRRRCSGTTPSGRSTGGSIGRCRPSACGCGRTSGSPPSGSPTIRRRRRRSPIRSWECTRRHRAGRLARGELRHSRQPLRQRLHRAREPDPRDGRGRWLTAPDGSKIALCRPLTFRAGSAVVVPCRPEELRAPPRPRRGLSPRFERAMTPGALPERRGGAVRERPVQDVCVARRRGPARPGTGDPRAPGARPPARLSRHPGLKNSDDRRAGPPRLHPSAPALIRPGAVPSGTGARRRRAGGDRHLSRALGKRPSPLLRPMVKAAGYGLDGDDPDRDVAFSAGGRNT